LALSVPPDLLFFLVVLVGMVAYLDRADYLIIGRSVRGLRRRKASAQATLA